MRLGNRFKDETARGCAAGNIAFDFILCIGLESRYFPEILGRRAELSDDVEERLRPAVLPRLRGARLEARIGEPFALDPSIKGREAYREAADGILKKIYALPDKPGETG